MPGLPGGHDAVLPLPAQQAGTTAVGRATESGAFQPVKNLCNMTSFMLHPAALPGLPATSRIIVQWVSTLRLAWLADTQAA